jgi:hypothetical protein
VPWGFDRILKKRLTVYDSNGRVALRCFGDRACRLAYVKALRAAVTKIETLGLAGRLEALDARIAPALARDRRRPYSRTKRARALEELRAFVRERPGEVRAQLTCFDGTRELDRDGDGAGCLDCDDADAARHPGAPEACNGQDDDCSGLVDDHPSCPCAPLGLPDRQLELCDLALAFDDAKAFCAARGQRLAQLADLEDAKRVERAARALSKSQLWIGLDDLAHEGRYRFLSGDKPKAALWDDGEPDAYACGEHCAALKAKGRGKLRDLHCATRLPFLCEAPAAAKSEGSLTPEKKLAEPVKEGDDAVH